MTTLYTVPARGLEPGMVITVAGRTSHPPITVTAVEPTITGTVRVSGFNASNPEPRLMFRSLAGNLRMIVEVTR